MSNKAKTLTMIRECARKMKSANASIPDFVEHDENEISEMRFHALDASTIDMMSDDAIAFNSAMRSYHAR